VFDRAVVQCGVNVLHRNTNADRHALASLLGGRHSGAALYQRCRSTERRPRIDETVFAPFSLRFRPFTGVRHVEKMPWRQAFGAMAIANTVEKRRKRSKRSGASDRAAG